jgi:hypothetical protein
MAVFLIFKISAELRSVCSCFEATSYNKTLPLHSIEQQIQTICLDSSPESANKYRIVSIVNSLRFHCRILDRLGPSKYCLTIGFSSSSMLDYNALMGAAGKKILILLGWLESIPKLSRVFRNHI